MNYDDLPIPMKTLGKRQIQVFLLLAQGLSHKDIGARLNISPKTVSTHFQNIKHAMGWESGSEIYVYAASHGLRDADAVNGINDSLSKRRDTQYISTATRLSRLTEYLDKQFAALRQQIGPKTVVMPTPNVIINQSPIAEPFSYNEKEFMAVINLAEWLRNFKHLLVRPIGRHLTDTEFAAHGEFQTLLNELLLALKNNGRTL